MPTKNETKISRTDGISVPQLLTAIEASTNNLRRSLQAESDVAVPAPLRRSIEKLLKVSFDANLSMIADRLLQPDPAAARNGVADLHYIAKLVEERASLEHELEANASRHRAQLHALSGPTQADRALLVELDTERAQRVALEAIRIEHLSRIAQLVGERSDLENELQANAARHRAQLASSHTQKTPPAPPPPSPLVEVAPSPPVALSEDLPQLTRTGRLDHALARTMQSTAREAFKSGRWAEAVSLYRDYLSYHPRRSAPWKQFAHALKENGQYALAERAYFRSLALDPTDVDTALHLGHLLKNHGKIDLAAEVFVGALKTRPDHIELRHSLGDLGKALPELTPPPLARPALKGLKAWIFKQRVARAQNAMKAQRWRDAAALYRKLADQRQDARLIVQYGHALKEGGDISGAEQAYRRALDLMPLSSDAWLQLGHALKLRGDAAEARLSYDAAVRLGPDNADALREI